MRPVFLALMVAAVSPIAASTPAGWTQVNEVQHSSERLDISAFAVNMSNIGTGSTATVSIRINSWSTEEEREHLITTMQENGVNALLRELQRQPSRGRFSVPNLRGPDPTQLRLGHDLRYTHQTVDGDGGRRIVIATDRVISFQEARNQPRTRDYPFTLFEIRVDKEGRGEGKVAVATRISFNQRTNTMTLENYASEPVRLNNVRVNVRS